MPWQIGVLFFPPVTRRVEVNYFKIGSTAQSCQMLGWMDLYSPLGLSVMSAADLCAIIGHLKAGSWKEVLLYTKLFQEGNFSLQIPYKSFPLHLIDQNGVTCIPTPRDYVYISWSKRLKSDIFPVFTVWLQDKLEDWQLEVML